MSELPDSLRSVDWNVTTWEGARREQLRRWAALPLDRVIAALEEMSALAEQFGPVASRSVAGRATPAARVAEPGAAGFLSDPGAPRVAASAGARGGALDPAILDEIVRRVVEVAAPDRIILFGSAARGDMGPDSDVDLLVIKSGVEHRRRLSQRIHRNLFGVPAAVDVVVASPQDLELYRDAVGTIIAPALREGREIYAG